MVSESEVKLGEAYQFNTGMYSTCKWHVPCVPCIPMYNHINYIKNAQVCCNIAVRLESVMLVKVLNYLCFHMHT